MREARTQGTRAVRILRSVQEDLIEEGRDDLVTYLESNGDYFLAFIQEQMKSPAPRRPAAPAGLTDAQHVQIIEKTVQAMKNPRRNRRRPVRRNAFDPSTGKLSYGADPAQTWKMFAKDTYGAWGGGLVVVATREALQNSVDAIRKAVKEGLISKNSGEFRVTINESENSITWEDNGTGMDREILGKFLDIGGSHGKRGKARDLKLKVRAYRRPAGDKYGMYLFRMNGLYQFHLGPQRGGKLVKDYVFDWSTKGAGGGFGVAKAVILGISSNFKWTMHTRNWLVEAGEFGSQPEPVEVALRPGTKLTVYNVDLYDAYDKSIREERPVREMIKDMLAYNDLPDIKLYLNGERIKPYFTNKRGTLLSVSGYWGDDPVPGSYGYPLNSSRESLKGRVNSTFEMFTHEIEKDETPTISEQDEIFDPGDPDAMAGMTSKQRQQLKEMDAGIEEALESDAMLEVVRGAAEASVALQKAMEAQQKGISKRKGESTAPGVAGRGVKETTPDRKSLESLQESADLMQAIEEGASPAEIAAMLLGDIEATDTQVKHSRGGTLTVQVATPEARAALQDIAEGKEIEPEHIEALTDVLGSTAVQATEQGGGGLQQVATVQVAITSLLDSIERAPEEQIGLSVGSGVSAAIATAKREKKLNPFGNLAGLYISKKGLLNNKGKYDSQRARNFKKNYAKWLPYLMFWDATLRLIAKRVGLTGPDAKFKPGFLLNDELLGLYTLLPSQTRVIYINPFALRDAVRIFKNNPIALAQFSMNIGIHEMAHMITGTKHADDEATSHGKEWATEREDMGNLMGPFLPGIALLGEQYLGLKRPLSMDAKRAQAEAKAELKKLKAQHKADLGKLQRKAAKLETKLTTSCPKCYKELIKALKEGGNLSTITWLHQKAG